MPEGWSALPLLRLGRLELGPGLRSLQPKTAASGLVVTAMIQVPDSGSERQYAWDVAWSDAAREASRLGADPRTAEALAAGAGTALADGTRAVVAAHGEVLLARWLPRDAGPSSVWTGPLPRLLEIAAAAARRPAHVVVLADRHGAAVVAHAAGEQHPARRFPVGARPGAQHDPHPGRPSALHHGERHVTDSEPESGGQRNAEFIAGRVVEAAASVGAHIVLGAGDQHVLSAISGHLPRSLGPVTTIASGPVPEYRDDQLSGQVAAALEEITTTAIGGVGELVASSAAGPEPAAVRGIEAVVQQLAGQQVAALLVAADIAADTAGSRCGIGSSPSELLAAGDPDAIAQVPLAVGLAWAALHQDAIVVQLPDRAGPLAGQPAAALLRRGPAA
jgi:hypothetical protein